MNVHHCGKIIPKDQRHKDMKYILRTLKQHNDGPHELDEPRPCGYRVTKTTWLIKTLKF